jgi:3-methyl-2-oxobutanoate hydroxymethyltransferase
MLRICRLTLSGFLPLFQVMPEHMRLSLHALRRRKAAAEAVPLVILTAYTAPVARAADAHADVLLVGDSLGMVLYDLPSTLPVTLEDMIRHGAAVVRASTRALVVVDMPFGSYQASPAQAFASAARVMQETGCQAVKLEGGAEMEETIRFLSERAIPVMAHVGLKPQHVHQHGGYRYQGRTAEEEALILADAQAVARAGAFAVVLECVVQEVAARVTQELVIPTIGIGSGAACDGQVLVSEDVLGMTPRAPRFVKRQAALAETMAGALGNFAEEVRSRTYPAAEHAVRRGG